MMPHEQEVGYLLLDIRHRLRVRGLHADGGDVDVSGKESLGGGKRDEDHIVLAAKTASAFRFHDTDDFEFDVFYPYGLPDRFRSFAEKIISCGRPQDGDFRKSAQVLIGNERSSVDLHIPHGRICGRDAHDRCVGVLATARHLVSSGNFRRDRFCEGYFFSYGIGVFLRERAGGTAAGTHLKARSALRAGPHDEKVGADGLDARLDRVLRSLPDRDHADDRTDADDDAQNRQSRPDFVSRKRDMGFLEDIKRIHEWCIIFCPCVVASLTMRPSLMKMIRLACCATSDSWVMRMTVRFCSSLSR